MALVMVDEIIEYSRFTLKGMGFQTIALIFGNLGYWLGLKNRWRVNLVNGEGTAARLNMRIDRNSPKGQTAEKNR